MCIKILSIANTDELANSSIANILFNDNESNSPNFNELASDPPALELNKRKLW